MGEYGINTAACATVTAPSKWYTREKFTKKKKKEKKKKEKKKKKCQVLSSGI